MLGVQCSQIRQDALYPTPTAPTGPGEVLEMDLFFYDQEKYLTTIDLFSKKAAVCKVESKTAQAVTRSILQSFVIFGCPKVLVTDRGREFYNERLRQVANDLEVKLHFTTPGHVGSHGTIERFHNTLTEHLHLLQLSKGLTGEEALTRAVIAYNHSVHSATGKTPFEVEHAGPNGETR